MNDFLIKLYTSIHDRNKFLTNIKYYSGQRFIIRILSNILIPLSFILSSFLNNKKNRLVENSDNRLIVSLTTFPARINKIWIVIECMLRQSVKPDRIVLWLSQEQFPDINQLPKRLLKLQERGLKIVICQGDLRSHKKYYYALQQFPNCSLITVDDDFMYPSNLLEELLKANSRNPSAICCQRAHKIKILDKEVLSYNEWDYIYGELGPAFNLFFTSGGGTLFPPNSLYKDATDKTIFMDKCRFADDVWLNAMSQLQGTQIIKISSKYSMQIPIIIKNDVALSTLNVNEYLNDKQISSVRAYFLSKRKQDIFDNILKNNNYI